MDLSSTEKTADAKPQKPRWSVDSILKKQETPRSSLDFPPKTEATDEFYPRRSSDEIDVVLLRNEPIVSLMIDGKERLCLAQISNTLLKNFSYNEIHNRRVALGINCVQCTPVQLEILRRRGAMPISSRRCGMITKREAERLVASFLEEHSPPKLPETFSFRVYHTCGWGCKGNFIPSRYNSSRAKCIECTYCGLILSPNKFIFHFHRTADSKYHHPDAANFNSWRRHLFLDYESPNEDLSHAWEDVKAMFNGGSRKRTSHSDLGARKTQDNRKTDSPWSLGTNYERSEDFCPRKAKPTAAFEERKKCPPFPLSLLYADDFMKGRLDRPQHPYVRHYMGGFQRLPFDSEIDFLRRFEAPRVVPCTFLQSDARFVECSSLRQEGFMDDAIQSQTARAARACVGIPFARNKHFDFQSQLKRNEEDDDEVEV